jgi:hypothetical protein
MAKEPDYYIATFQTGRGPFSWRWEIHRHSLPMGVKLGSSGFRSQADAELAGKQTLERFLVDLAREERKR